ncbi:MAG TPA: Holliday junction resolvase RuvX [Alphaproteobacteria bacterium]|nr:Holliday junction resolvase RuvX [Alphaproteobacteria bacterium]
MTNYTMISSDFKDFPSIGRLLGIDWGARRVGLAVSDEKQEFIFTRPQIVVGKESLVEKIVKTAGEEKIVAVVIGLPIRSDGSESDTTKQVREFAQSLSDKLNLPIFFTEENLTSFEAEENLRGDKKLKQKLDSESARIILENAIALARRNK